MMQYLLQMLDTLVYIIGIQPDQGAFPHFFLVIYPFLQEPRDAEEYAEIADKLKVWRVKFKLNYDLMKEMFTSIDKWFGRVSYFNNTAQGFDDQCSCYI